ncbi:MAG TPA: hypothetical protein VF144_14810, partial [Chitinophagaceae bacterium]
MEVHAHTHTSRKKWTHYFWEFLMLFLAVFCGFMAEYQLEHKIEKEREKEYIKSLIDDLKTDAETIDGAIIAKQQEIERMDSLINFLNQPQLIKENGDQVYYIGRVGPRTQTFTSTNKTFEQLKNAGGFRLIRNSKAAGNIMSYYSVLPFIRQLEEIYDNEFTEYKRVAAKIFDPAIFRSTEAVSGGIIRTTDNPQLRSSDPELLKELSVYSI